LGDNGTVTMAFKYDPEGNRIAQRVTNASGTTRRKYIVDTASSLPTILIELDPDNSNQVVKSYLYDNNSQILIQYDGSMAGGDKYFYLADRLGTIRQIIDVNGDVKHLYTHGPFGNKFLEPNVFFLQFPETLCFTWLNLAVLLTPVIICTCHYLI